MKKIGLVMPFSNFHVSSIFEEMRSLYFQKVDVTYYIWNELPTYRHENGWTTPKGTTHLSRSFFKQFRNIKKILKNDVIFFLGMSNPFPQLLICLIVVKLFKKRIVIISEGLRNDYVIGLKKNLLRFLLNSKSITLLAIGTNSTKDYKETLGLTNWEYRRFCFHEKYFPYELVNPSRFDIEPEIVNIIAVGRLIKRKNFGLIIQTLNRYKGNKRVQLLICGEGDELLNLQLLVDHSNPNVKVIFMGHCDSLELENIYKNAHIFVLPSLYDGWGAVVNQAIHYCVPAIISDQVRSGEDYLIKNNVNGYIFDSESEFEDNLFKLIENADLRKSFSQKACEIKNLWSLQNVAYRLLRFITGEEIEGYKNGPMSRIID